MPLFMKATHKTRRFLRLKNTLLVVLFISIIGMLAWLSTRYDYQADWTASGRHTLSAASVALLNQAKGPITVSAFVRAVGSNRKSITEMIARYQRHKADIQLTFVDPTAAPNQVRDEGVSAEGELVLRYAGRKEIIRDTSEQGITNALQRLLRNGERWIVFLEGHGERNPLGRANHDLGDWVRQIEAKGFKAQTLNLATHGQIPDNTTTLVIAGPQLDLLPGEVTLIQRYLAQGGSLLWLGDPGSLHGLAPIARLLGVEFLPGVIVDPSVQVYSINNPAFALAADYGNHIITRGFNVITLFPIASGLKITAPEGWQSQPFIITGERSWAETGPLAGEIRYTENEDIAGPLTLGASISRTLTPDDKTRIQQRVVVLGDGDFLSNAYLGNGGNLNLGMNIMNWLSRDETLIAIPVKTAPDLNLALSPVASGIIAVTFLFGIPLLLAGAGLLIWVRRRRQ
jgi:ABC-type uncharacterized transport system involved in gliding motility auxiliary subunit